MSIKGSESKNSFLSLAGATFRLGDRLVFENTTWTFRRDEHWAIIGPNGAGKSLLADALRGRLPLVGGELRYHFRPPVGLDPEEAIGHVSFEDQRAGIDGVVVQSRWNSFEQEGALRVREFLSYERVMEINPFEVNREDGPARRQFAKRQRRAVAWLQIGSLLDRAVLSLSNGENQRVRLARALCHPLRLLILDEPYAGLDAGNRARFHRVLDRLMETALRVLLITTRLEDLPRRVTHLLHVDQCRIVAAGSRERMRGLATPASLVARAPRSDLPRRSAAVAARPQAGSSDRKEELVRLRNVTVRYGTVTLLRDLDWTVCAGESWALLGPNGSGKTTLLSLILGDNPQAYGHEVVVFGQRRGAGESIWELKKRIGWVSPELHLHFNAAATCFEVVASGWNQTIGLFEPPTSRQRSAARHWLRTFHLLEFACSPLFALSAGEQRMALLARALVRNPRLLVLDEPCQGLDLAHRRRFVNLVDALVRSGSVAVIYVTHRPDEIPPSIHRVFRLEARTHDACTQCHRERRHYRT